jgi:hypothetical protein
MLHLDNFNGRICVFGWTGDLDNYQIASQAINSLPLVSGRKYFLGSGRVFFIIKEDDLVEFGRYRENWNGYDDLARYRISTGVKVSNIIQPNYAEGRHRATFED